MYNQYIPQTCHLSIHHDHAVMTELFQGQGQHLLGLQLQVLPALNVNLALVHLKQTEFITQMEILFKQFWLIDHSMSPA